MPNNWLKWAQTLTFGNLMMWNILIMQQIFRDIIWIFGCKEKTGAFALLSAFKHKCWVYWDKDSYFLSLNENYCHHATNYSLSNLNSWLQRKNSCTCTSLSIIMDLLFFCINNFCLPIFRWLLWKICLYIRIIHK